MSNIAWTEQTWNPIVGCSIASKGCKNCYAMKMAHRICCMHPNSHYQGTVKKVNGAPVWTGKMAMAPESILVKPLKRKKPTVYFVNSMGDLFHEDVPDSWIDQVFDIIYSSPQHTFQILTKRASRMREYIRDIPHAMPNVWLGVSAEDQKQADERIPHLLETPAVIRFVSFEPQLEDIQLSDTQLWGRYNDDSKNPGIHWAIQGCESGPGARRFDLSWARSMRDQCGFANVPYFLKQIPFLGKIEKEPMLDCSQHLAMPDLKPAP